MSDFYECLSFLLTMAPECVVNPPPKKNIIRLVWNLLQRILGGFIRVFVDIKHLTGLFL